MADSSYNCDVSQGFNFQKDAQILVGHIVTLKIGDKEIKADLNVSNPEDSTKYIPVVGVLSSIYWQGGYADPVAFYCQVTTENKNILAQLQHLNMQNTDVEMKYTVYDFDPVAKKYYKCFHSGDDALLGLVEKSGGDLALNIDLDQSTTVISPKNYALYVGVMPQDQNMAIHLAFSDQDKIAKKWGVEVKAA